MTYVSRFIGTCNQCGQCCVESTPIGLIACEHLERVGPVGQVGATRCRMHDTRVNGQPIVMRRMDNDTVWGLAFCAKDSPLEDAVIAARGIGRGCSLVPR